MSEETRDLFVYFIKEYRTIFNKYNKKCKSDYVLNIDKITRERFNDSEFFIMNKNQAFLLNYEIKKLLDKAVNIGDWKYSRIVYVNSNMSITSVLNNISFLKQSYPDIKFNFVLIDPTDEFKDINEKKEAKDLLIQKSYN